MTQYLLRLDDASPYRDFENWNRIEALLYLNGIAPIVGIIPDNKDIKFSKYPFDSSFWSRARQWQEQGWCIALHGYNHVYTSRCGGLNPVNQKSEFAGLPLADQEEKIARGISILSEHGIKPMLFFAPSHTFDENTLLALKNKSDIRIISDTIANDIYYKDGFFFIPQQSGSVRRLPFKIVTFCYHPDTMDEKSFIKLEQFIKSQKKRFIKFSDLKLVKRKQTIYDKFLALIYFHFK